MYVYICIYTYIRSHIFIKPHLISQQLLEAPYAGHPSPFQMSGPQDWSEKNDLATAAWNPQDILRWVVGWQETLSPQVRYVLDFGIVRKMVFDEERAMQSARPGDWEHDMPLARQSPGDSLTWFSQKKTSGFERFRDIFRISVMSCQCLLPYPRYDGVPPGHHRLSFFSRSLCNTWSSQATCRQRAAGLFS